MINSIRKRLYIKAWSLQGDSVVLAEIEFRWFFFIVSWGLMSFIFCFTEPGIMLCHLEQLLLSCIVLCLVKVCASLKAQDEASVNDHDIVRRQAMGHSFGDELEGFDLDPKRVNNWNQFPAWGKRLSKRRWSSLGAWGKRSWLDRLISANNNWGKRWKSMSNSWGKRQAPSEFDGLSDDYINIKKRSVDSKSSHNSRNKRSIPTELSPEQNEEKRRWSSLSAWGKRSDDDEKRRWSSLSAWGKRSNPEAIDDNDSDNISKRKWSSFSSWGKRGDPVDLSKRLYSYWQNRLMTNNPWMERRGWNAFSSWGKRSMD